MVQKSVETLPVILMDYARIKRTLHRMAYQIAEDNKEQHCVLLIGLKERGHMVAKLLSEYLAPLSKHDVVVHQLFDNDDGSEDFSEKYSYIILVDDVIFSGSTMYNALQITLDNMHPQTIRTAVLVDRGHRKMPVEASFAGLRLPTKLNEHVSVRITKGQMDSVVLIHKPA